MPMIEHQDFVPVSKRIQSLHNAIELIEKAMLELDAAGSTVLTGILGKVLEHLYWLLTMLD